MSNNIDDLTHFLYVKTCAEQRARIAELEAERDEAQMEYADALRRIAELEAALVPIDPDANVAAYFDELDKAEDVGALPDET